MAATVTLTGRSGPFQFVHRDLARWPRNSKPPTIDVSRLRGFTVHYAGGAIGSIYGPGTLTGPLAIAADEALIGQTIRYHVAKPGMTDVGYNFLVGRSGVVYEGRGAMAMNGANGPILASIADRFPAGTRTTNPYYVSVFVCVGTDVAEPTTEQVRAVTALCAFLADSYGIAHPEVNGHRDVRATACPGDATWRLLPSIRAAIDPATAPACAISNPAHPEWACWPANRSKPTIGAGSHGDAVAYLHGVLKYHGYTVPVVVGTGEVGNIWTPATGRAVGHVQQANRLAVDYVCGPSTWAVIDTLARKAK